MFTIIYCIFASIFIFYTPVKGDGYICDFSAEKFNIDFDDYYDDVICDHEIENGDSIGIIIPRYKDENGYINVRSKCFDEVSLNIFGDRVVSIYDLYGKDEISVSNENKLHNSEYRSSILQLKNVNKNNRIYCIFENINEDGALIHKGITKISIENNISKKEDNKSNRHVIDIFNKIDLNVDNSNNKYDIEAKPGDILYMLGTNLLNNEYIYFDDNCAISFEIIGQIYKYVFPIINEKDITYICTMYINKDGNKTNIGELNITFKHQYPTISAISKDVLKKYIKYDVEKKLNKILFGTQDDGSNNVKYAEQGIDVNKGRTSNAQGTNIGKDHCNNNACVELFSKSKCSSMCGNGYRLMEGYDIKYDTQSVIPCNNGNCTIEDEIEPFIIFAWASIVFFCIMFAILVITIYFILEKNKTKKIKPADPFLSYDTNIK
ncbi:sporozoite surface protein 3, putative [Plasmodium chabaudi adami]|uniref:Sporozoite surface protein 3, putative n=1 Tax=Plasmodium chabaudi adami TaxID=5826 RepID=A0A1C6YNS0_PLACE|nr:sporozoite surface protein 3, putative [Plasmodium chabaudi adami]